MTLELRPSGGWPAAARARPRPPSGRCGPRRARGEADDAAADHHDVVAGGPRLRAHGADRAGASARSTGRRGEVADGGQRGPSTRRAVTTAAASRPGAPLDTAAARRLQAVSAATAARRRRPRRCGRRCRARRLPRRHRCGRGPTRASVTILASSAGERVPGIVFLRLDRASTSTVVIRTRPRASLPPSASSRRPGDLGLGARQRYLAEPLREQAADRVDVGLLQRLELQRARSSWRASTNRRRAPRGLPPAAGPRPAACRRSPATSGTSSASYSSVISPTISSRMSSMVTTPAVPPYSSTTIAMWLRAALHLLEQLVDPLAVGDEHRAAHHGGEHGGRAAVGSLGPDEVLEVGDADDVVDVLAEHRQPRVAAAQGQPQRPCRRACRARSTRRRGGAPSPRGRACRPARTPSGSSGARPRRRRPLVLAMSTSSRSSTSEENGPCAEALPGVTALPIRISSRVSGPSSVAERPHRRGEHACRCGRGAGGRACAGPTPMRT